jgi:signal transduction histidine kinase
VRAARRLGDVGRHLLAVLGAPGLMIGVFSLVSFGFGLFVLANEYDRPRQAARAALRRLIGQWVRAPDYLGLTLVDHADSWRNAAPADRLFHRDRLRDALAQLGEELDRQGERFPLIHVVAMELLVPGKETLARWQAPARPGPAEAEVLDAIPLLDDDGPSRPEVVLRLRYRVAGPLEGAERGVEASFRRVLLGLLGLSGFSLLCLGYMILQAQALSRRVARESAQEATLDLADRACHELGNGVFVLSNERRNLAGHLDLVERYLSEEPLARKAAARRVGLGPEQATRFDQALRRELAARGIEPEVELRGSAAIARHVCRQIDVCSEYIRLTVRELDGFLKRTALPVMTERVAVSDGFDEALALLRPRLDAAGAAVARDPASEAGVSLRADRRLFIHALVNLLKNAQEAVSAPGAGDPPEIALSVRAEGATVWVSVADNGPGIPPPSRKRIFEDGFTTKGPGRGRGLAIVRESVYVQDGAIDVRDRPGGGTEFLIGLPADASQPPDAPQLNQAASA